MLKEININLNIFLDKKKIKLMNLRSEEITKISSEIAKLKICQTKTYFIAKKIC